MRLLNFYGAGSPPSTYDAPLLANTYEVTVLAIYSAVNTVAEVIDCYKSQIAEAFLFILLVLAVAILVAALTAGFGLGPAVVAVTATMATTTANASSKKGPGCELPKMRLQLQVSPRESGEITFQTLGYPMEGQAGVGVTTRQVRDGMTYLFENRPSWFVAGIDLRGVIISMSICIKKYPPFGTNGEPRQQICSLQQMEYKGRYYRLDLENIRGVNLKE